MTDMKRLLADATPLPWGIDHESPKTIVAHDGTGAFVMRLGDARVFSYAVQMSKNVDLALAAVNAVPDYEAAVDALAALADAATALENRAIRSGGEFHVWAEERMLTDARDVARAALARLRGAA